MALIVNLQCVEYLTGKFDRIVRLTFRGKTFQSNVVSSAKRVAYFGQSFQWPVARTIDSDEALTLELFNFNKYLSNKLVGSFILLLQQVIQEGELKLSENLVDFNNRVIEASVSFTVRYHSPDGRVGNWSCASELTYPISGNPQFEKEGFENESMDNALGFEDVLDVFDSMSGLDDAIPGEDTASQNIIMESLFAGRRVRPDILDHEMHKPKDFQVTVTIIEGQQLAGLDIDPVILIEVGTEYRYTSIRQSSNCPYYNEYFVFNFHETPAMIFDKIIGISAFHAYGIPGRKLLRAGNLVAAKRLIGSFRCDLGMVYVAPDHQFYHKWAVLLDPNDVEAGPKGYIKCDITVSGRGQTVKPPKSVKDTETDNIEGNLLLPVGVSKNRQRAVYSVCIYRAEDLPQTDMGILASVQKAFTNKEVAFIDAFVQVSFVGLIGKTTVQKSYFPEWNEVLRFADMFPPLCNRIKIQLVDEDAVSNETVATHFIELSQIMDPGSEDGEGMLPTYGPSWIYFYGAQRNYKILPGDDNLNEGIGEGTAYRGRLLISINTTFEPGNVTGPSAVYRDKLQAGRVGDLPRKPFLLFATIFEASMIDREQKDKPIYFEISVGKFGNTLDGKGARKLFKAGDKSDDDDDNEDDGNQRRGLLRQRKEEEAELPCHSTTNPMMMHMMIDKTYGYLPINREKPCLYVVGNFEDFRKRLLHSNLIGSIASKLNTGLDDVREMVRNKHNEAHRRLKGVIQELLGDCAKYHRHADNLRSGVSAGRTKLDRHLRKASLDYIKKATKMAESIRKTTFAHNVMTKYLEAREISRRLEHLAREPQHSMPDVLLWMICDGQRVAYYRFPARDLFHCAEKDLIGKHCGQAQTIFLKKPGKKLFGQSGWIVQAKLNIQLWFGEYNSRKTVKDYLENLPHGYEPIYEFENTDIPPIGLLYEDPYIFQLRAYIFQARSLIGSDSTGLSDPFARVIVNNYCKTTQIIEETLCPTWDQSLVIDNILIYGIKQDLLAQPPLVIVEIYDYDKVGQPEFLGRVIASPKVTLEDEEYREAQLEWWDIYRGSCRAGQLLASFELLEGNEMGLPPLPPVRSSLTSREPIMSLPPGIKPAMKDFRMEVLFRGVRELPRIQLLAVDHPRIAVECAGRTILSVAIADIERNMNFEKQVDFIDVELPENENFWPPLIIRCIDSRTFGRNILVGTCTIDNIQDFMWQPSVDDPPIPGFESPAILEIGQNNGNVSSSGLLNRMVSTQTSAGLSTPGVNQPGSNGPLALTNAEVQFQQPSRATLSAGKGPENMSSDKKKSSKLTEEPLNSNKYREIIADFDWWSKYYVTKQEAAQAAIESNKGKPEKDPGSSRVLEEEDEPDYHMQMLDYSSLDMTKLDKEIEEARVRQKAIESSKEVSKKKKKKNKKKAAKANFKKFKGAINHAFVRDSAMDDDLNDGSGIIKDRDECDDNSHVVRIKYYPVELENVPEYGGFKKWFQMFKLYRGKKVDDDEEDSNRLSGLFKGNFCIYKIAAEQVIERQNSGDGVLAVDEKDAPKLKLAHGLPSHRPIDVRIIVYIVRCLDLHPVDFNGMADPYIVLHCGKQKIVDKEHKINNQLNPIFGRSFEMDVTFPMESILKIQIWDYDTLSADDLIGETTIDLEDRYFSPNQARCGIQDKYEIFGYNVWRNPLKPSKILEGLCADLKMEAPKYLENSVVVGGVTFESDEPDGGYVENELGERKLLIPNEHLALKVLKNWQTVPGGCHLVPEYVETRTLFCDERPGVEQGKLEMWIDMFPKDSPMPTNVVDITPRQPKSYELRCIIWNTDEVTLDDTNVLTGERSSDIFVKGYLKGVGEDDQQTDVHYRSLTGEGNFNWRFIYRFDYLKAEDKIIFKKSMMLGMSEIEFKTPPNLTLQVWDADLVSADDFLGSITLNLNKLVKPAKDVRRCSLKMVEKEGKVPTLNLFKNKRCKGWWPVVAREKEEEDEDDKTEKLILKGKVEAELHLLTVEEADKNPVGVAREDPEKLPDPKRPDSSFLWIFNPLKSIRYILWKNYKWYIITFLIILALALLLAVFVYHLPNYLARRVFYSA